MIMSMDIQSLSDSILESLSQIEYIPPASLPKIELYMDQVITFMDGAMQATKRFPDDKILTKDMVNNYVKNKLLPPPERKKYSKEHLLTLIFIYYFKNSLSIQDIQSILAPITDRYWDVQDHPSLEEIYDAIFSLEEKEMRQLQNSIREARILSQEAIDSLDALNEDDEDFLQKFSFICLMSFDIYVRKLLIEKIIDSMKTADSKK